MNMKYEFDVLAIFLDILKYSRRHLYNCQSGMSLPFQEIDFKMSYKTSNIEYCNIQYVAEHWTDY